MNGAQALLKTLTDAGIDTCFANPGTSEMQLVYEIGLNGGMRPVLCLQENVVTGAADGYWRMRGKPAVTLLHVGSGFANGIANLHNAGRGHSGVLNIVGANASYHQPNYPEHEFISGTIKDVAGPVSHWCREARNAADLAQLGALAAAEAQRESGHIATLIAPTQCHWEPVNGSTAAAAVPPLLSVSEASIDEAVQMLQNGKKTLLLLGSRALRDHNLEIAARIAAHCKASYIGETFPSRMRRGAGCIALTTIPYFLELGQMTLAEYEQILLFGANEPVSTFAYQNKALSKVPPGCTLHCIASPEHDITNALMAIEAKVGSSQETVPRVPAPTDNTAPLGELSSAAIGRSIRLLMPDNAIMVDEGATAAMGVINETQFGPKHDYLYTVCGGAIGAGLPITLGASVACPERKIITLQADGSALYTNQALWSLAREQSDAIIIVLKNNAYAILNVELARVSAEPPNAAMQAMMNLDQPTIDWVQLAQSMGVRATSVSTAEGFHEAFAEAVNGKGPVLIEAVIAQDLSAAIAMMRAQG